MMGRKKTTQIVCVAMMLIAAAEVSCAQSVGELPGSSVMSPQEIGPWLQERVRRMESRLRSSGLAAMRRAWSLELVPGDEEALGIKILPASAGQILRVSVPQSTILREGEVEKAAGLAANALCWLGSEPHPLARPYLPHWLTLGWKGWLETGRHAAYEQVVWRARTIGRVPGLQEIVSWQEDEFTRLEEDYRTAFCYWLLRSLLRDAQRASLFFAMQQSAATEALELLPRGWWNQRVAEARGQLRNSPFLSLVETRHQLLLLMANAPSALPSAAAVRSLIAADAAKGSGVGDVSPARDGARPGLNRRLSRTRDVRGAVAPDARPSLKVEELGANGWVESVGDSGRQKEQERQHSRAEKGSIKDGASRREISGRGSSLAASVSSAYGPVVADGNATQSLLDLVRGGKNAASLNALRQARYAAVELTRLGSPVYRDATARLAVALTVMERRWDAVSFERELRLVQEEVARIARLEGEVSAALDWAEVVFLGAGGSAALEDYLEWQQGLERPMSPGEKINDILLWRERAARFSPAGGRFSE